MCIYITIRAACWHRAKTAKHCTRRAKRNYSSQHFIFRCSPTRSFCRNLIINGDHYCPFCLANPDNYRKGKQEGIPNFDNFDFPQPPDLTTPPSAPSQIPPIPVYSEEFINTVLEKYGKVIDGSWIHRVTGDPRSFNRVSDRHLEWLHAACDYV